MPDPLMPDLDQAARMVPTPDSVIWRYGGDARLLAVAGYPVLLQVAHPTVGAGVAEHSDFKSDPWGRLFRTLDYSYAMTYGGPRLAWEVGRRVREMHKGIKGTKPDGERYHALEPKAYAWVHATLADAIVRGHRHVGTPIPPSELESFWAEWRRQGRLVGVRERDLPETWSDFGPYFERMVDDCLEDNVAVQDTLEALASPAAPPLPLVGEGVWRVARLPAVHSTALLTVGLLPEILRKRFGVEWTRRRQRQFRALAAALRAATPLLPRSLRNVGPLYLRRRREALQRGDVAAPSRAPRTDSVPM